MRALSEQQILRCETARNGRCRCRCQGALHGIQIEGYRQELMFSIPEEQRHVRAEASQAPSSGSATAPSLEEVLQAAAATGGTEGKAA